MTFYATLNDGMSAYTVEADDREQAYARVRLDLRGTKDPEALHRLIVLTAREWNTIGVRARSGREFRKLVAAEAPEVTVPTRSPWARNGHRPPKADEA